jgi:UDP-N-acetyl-D-glucosamine dehydrogenase
VGSRGKLVVVGQGYVGLPLAMRAVEVGYDVVGYEVEEARVLRLAAGESYVGDISSPRLRSALATGRYHPTSDPAHVSEFDIAVISVPTPLRDGAPDLSFIESASEMLASHVSQGSCVVLESTTYPGTTEELVAPLLEQGSGLRAGIDFHLGYSPERIVPGDPDGTLEKMPKVVSGVDAASLARVQSFYDDIVEETVPIKGTREAELTKLLENTFRHVNIALVSELAMFASDLGIDVWAAIDAASTKPYGFMRFDPGPGVGGHCLPIDPSYLAWKVEQDLGAPFRFVELANEVNEFMPEYTVRRLDAGLERRGRALEGATVLLVGLAYKPETGDAR